MLLTEGFVQNSGMNIKIVVYDTAPKLSSEIYYFAFLQVGFRVKQIDKRIPSFAGSLISLPESLLSQQISV